MSDSQRKLSGLMIYVLAKTKGEKREFLKSDPRPRKRKRF